MFQKERATGATHFILPKQALPYLSLHDDGSDRLNGIPWKEQRDISGNSCQCGKETFRE